MRKYVVAAILVEVGIVIAFPLFSMGCYTMVRTSTPQFCGSCHEIKPAVLRAGKYWPSRTHLIFFTEPTFCKAQFDRTALNIQC
jgi:cytochrome c-type protein NapC/trimethylamine-N-oxide reductase cytochrome c-type subunit TorC